MLSWLVSRLPQPPRTAAGRLFFKREKPAMGFIKVNDPDGNSHVLEAVED